MHEQRQGLHIVLISVHGLIRGHDLELGRDADTGGQSLYVIELMRALARQSEIAQVDLLTRLVKAPDISVDYQQQFEQIEPNARIVRIEAGPDGYLPKEELWDFLDIFTDNAVNYFRTSGFTPDIIHSHYADAGYVGSTLTNMLGIPLLHTGHSLGRVKRHRLLASGLSVDEIEQSYNMARRIEAEELTLASAERVITSTYQEIEEQYELYDHYQPEQMRVVAPGTDMDCFYPPKGDELDDPIYSDIKRFLNDPKKPFILALSRPDKRKNITALIEAYGQSIELQACSNLVIVVGNRDDIDEFDDATREVYQEIFSAIDRYDLYGKVAIPKHHRRDQVAVYYRLASYLGGVFVNPALTEPFGLTLLEAAASGLPIVATEDGGPRDIVSNCHNGILIDPLDTESIISGLMQLFCDKPLWLDCSEQGLIGVREYYSWDAHARRYLDIVNPVVSKAELLVRKPLQRRKHMYRERAIISDIDQNLLGDVAALEQLIVLIRQNRKSSKFGIATGRRLDSALSIMKKHAIPEPDILITSGGTEIYYAPKLNADTAWRKHIDYHWTPHIIKQVLATLPGLELQPKKEQSRFKISYFINQEIAPTIDEINSLLHKEEQSANVNLAFGQFLDITPIRASKGMALRYVADRWQLPLERIFVAGGSGADEDMMKGNTLAAVAANRHHEELSQLADVERIYFSKSPYAQGIIEALDYYDFFNSCGEPSDKPSDKPSNKSTDCEN